ncbi:MAG: glycosyltransferase [Armatimonadetes bacterium]|nr:glycosyltransferase [Anaerolineae bacterium]
MISLITSLYRTEAHLPTYIDHAAQVAQQVRATGVEVEFILVANDATEREHALLAAFATSDETVRVLHVPRESVYASWNRGVEAAHGQALGFWNVDDIRTADALIAGYRRIIAGCALVYFAHTVVRTTGTKQTRKVYPAVPYDAEVHRAKMKCGPFFMFTPSLYAQIGAFDARFRIAGDWEWCVRATYQVDFCALNQQAGTFLLHGGNLSDTGNPLQLVEENVVHLLNGGYQRLVPADPVLMRDVWGKWGLPLDAEIASLLWGADAAQHALAWQQTQRRARRQSQLERAIRFVPRLVIKHLRLRPLLARLGIVQSD